MIITSDNSFTWSNDGPICYADMKDGEIVEAWRKPTYSSVALETSYNGVVCCSNNVPVVEKERLRPEVIRTPDGQTVLDFKQNIAGFVEFFVKAPKGLKITMVMGEKLNDEGNFTIKISPMMENIRNHTCKKSNISVVAMVKNIINQSLASRDFNTLWCKIGRVRLSLTLLRQLPYIRIWRLRLSLIAPMRESTKLWRTLYGV